jgi:ATP-dependent phosphofructokinase / diphosphate-dependent phosphofructokinase
MVALIPPDVESIPIREAIGRMKAVPVNNDVIESAREIGVSFGAKF